MPAEDGVNQKQPERTDWMEGFTAAAMCNTGEKARGSKSVERVGSQNRLMNSTGKSCYTQITSTCKYKEEKNSVSDQKEKERGIRLDRVK